MGEGVDAGFRERDCVIVVEDMRRDLEALLVGFVNRRQRERDWKARRPASAVIDPDFDDIDLPGRLLLYGAADLVDCGYLISETGIDGIARTGVRGADATPGEQQASSADASLRLICPDLKHDIASLDAERHHGGNPRVKRAVEIIKDGLAFEILRQVGQSFLEAGMHMSADDRRHDGLAVEIEPRAARRQGNIALTADAGDCPALDQ